MAMDLKLNRNNQLPVHAQLKAQLVYLIQSGQLAAGAQLPTVRQLAGFLRVNRNTVSRVFSEMQRDGILSCEPGRGTFVAASPAKSESKVERMNRLVEVVDEAMEKADQLGFTPEEVFLTLYARTQALPAKARPAVLPRALFIECTRQELVHYRDVLQQELPVAVDTMLVGEFAAKAGRNARFLKPYDVVVTTFYHIHEVEALLAGKGIEVMALLVDTSLDTLMRLTGLDPGTKVGVACTDWSGSENMKLSIQRAGLKHLQVVLGCGCDQASLARMIAEASVVVCSSLIEHQARQMAPEGKQIIVDHKRVDRAGIELLRRRLKELAARKTSVA